MAGFGGSIKLTGEDEYRKALNQITQSLREVSSQMTLTSAQYEASDKKSRDLKNAQNELNSSFQKQKAEVDNLRSAYESFKSKVDTQAQAHQKLVADYEKEKAELDRLGNTLGTTSKEYQDQKSKVDDLAQEVTKSSKANDENQKALSKMGTALNKAETDLAKTEVEMRNLGKETKNTGDGFTVFKGILANLGTQAINTALNGLKAMGSALLNVGKQAIESYADYEQLVGGVETLFGNSAKEVQKYANEAYKSAGLSANQYMETVTSFSASLLQSLDGDTAKAAEYSNRAITDMSDNANKMGTDMSMIQNAYQGFAKQNYTMLDNLKLGYGGTKTEMERLIKEASQMTDVQDKLNLSVKDGDMSFGNIVNAISVVQSKMGIMGTTADEASRTISGSVNTMKSSWSNLLTGIADDNADFTTLVNNFVDSLVAVGNNLLPRIQTVIEGIGTLISQLLTVMVPQIVETIPPLITSTLPILISAVETAIQSILAVLPQIVDSISPLIPQIVQMLISMLPQLIDAGIKIILSLIDGIAKALPELIKMLPTIIKQIVDVLLNNLPAIIQTGVELLVALIEGLAEAIPQLVDYIPEIVETIITVLLDNLPLIVESAIKIMVALIQGLTQALPKLIKMVPQIIKTIATTLSSNLPQILSTGVQILTTLIKGIGSMLGNLGSLALSIGKSIIDNIKTSVSTIGQVGLDIVKGLWNGIKNAKDWLIGKVKDFAKSILTSMKNALGIHSPSQLFEDEVGTNIALGIGQGFTDEMKNVSRQMQSAIPTNFDTDVGLNTNTSLGSSGAYNNYNYNMMLNAFQEALGSMKIELDDEVAGKFVKDTVATAIYT